MNDPTDQWDKASGMILNANERGDHSIRTASRGSSISLFLQNVFTLHGIIPRRISIAPVKPVRPVTPQHRSLGDSRTDLAQIQPLGRVCPVTRIPNLVVQWRGPFCHSRPSSRVDDITQLRVLIDDPREDAPRPSEVYIAGQVQP